MLVIPAAARLTCWLNAWIAGRSSADATISGVTAGDSSLAFQGVEPGSLLAPAMLLGEIRRRRVSRASLALPYPGNLVGLGGPSDFNAAALEAGQAVVLWDIDLGLVPESAAATGSARDSTTDSGSWTASEPGRASGTSAPRRTVWVATPARPPTFLPDVATADRTLNECLITTADTLAALDVAAWSPDAADALLNLRTSASWDASMTFGGSVAAGLVTRGLRCIEIVRLALRDEGGALTAQAAADRRHAMAPLREASHAAVVAGCSTLDGR